MHVVVESPVKAKTAGNHLDSGYCMLGSYGHVSELPAKDGSVRPAGGFAISCETGRRARRALDLRPRILFLPVPWRRGSGARSKGETGLANAANGARFDRSSGDRWRRLTRDNCIYRESNRQHRPLHAHAAPLARYEPSRTSEQTTR